MMGGSQDSTSSSSEEEDERSKRKKKSSKSKSKLKKHKSKDKHKKRKHRRRYSTSPSSAGSSCPENEWVEKDTTVENESGIAAPAATTVRAVDAGTEDVTVRKSQSVKQEEDDWMGIDSIIPTYSNDWKKEKRKTKKEWDKLRSNDLPGQHTRELNPHWKDGGTGLPSEEISVPSTSKSAVAAVGDGGLGWLKKAYQRAKEQAKEENRSLEEVATERWGSLDNFYSMLEQAEKKSKMLSSSAKSKEERHYSQGRGRTSFKKPRRDSDDEDEEISERSYYADRERDRARSIGRHRSAFSSSQRPHEPSWMKKSASFKGTSYHGQEDDEKSEHSRYQPQSSSSPKQDPKKSFNEIDCDSQASAIVESESLDIENQKSEVPTPNVLTDKEMNELSAKIIKAELLGNSVLMAELKEKHAKAEADRRDFIKGGGDVRKQQESSRGPKIVTKIVMDTSSRGGKRSSNKPGETHKDGQRVRYFPDDDNQTLQNMFQREKGTTAEDENALFSRIAGKSNKAKPTDDYDLDDIFADKASSSKGEQKEKEREVRRVIDEEKHYNKTLEACQWCFDGKKLEKNIVIAMGEKSYLCIPPYQSLTDGHCLIVPMFHSCSATELDEDVWSEMQKFRRAIVNMFKAEDKDVVVFETAVFLKRLPHMYLECVPMPRETGELAPIYFKKAIQECETEWAQNKKLVDLKDRDVRKCVPKGLPYFCVDFGCDSGFAHVIEDERAFPNNFAQEIIGGMMELDHFIWRKRKHDNFKVQKEKLMKFLETWAPYDWTREAP